MHYLLRDNLVFVLCLGQFFDFLVFKFTEGTAVHLLANRKTELPLQRDKNINILYLQYIFALVYTYSAGQYLTSKSLDGLEIFCCT